MLELMRKMMLSGIGVAVLTKEKVEELAKELAETGKLTEKEGKELLDDMSKKWKEGVKQLDARIESVVSKAIGKVNLATKSDLAALTARIEQLEKAAGQKKT